MTNPRIGIAHLRSALAGDPDDPAALVWLWGLYLILGQPDKGAAYGERRRRLDPLNSFWVSADGASDYYCGNFAAACGRLGEAVQNHPDHFIARFYHALALTEEGDVRASAIPEGLARDAPEQGMARLGLAIAHAFSGDEEAAERTLTPDLLAWARHDLELSMHVAQVYALLRRPQDAFHWLEHAVEAGFINYPFLTRDRLLDSLRGEERFGRLMERVKREWEAFDA